MCERASEFCTASASNEDLCDNPREGKKASSFLRLCNEPSASLRIVGLKCCAGRSSSPITVGGICSSLAPPRLLLLVTDSSLLMAFLQFKMGTLVSYIKAFIQNKYGFAMSKQV